MKLNDYLKEKWIPLLFLSAAFLFAFLVYRLDIGFSIRESNAVYIVMGWSLLFVVYLLIDFYLINSGISRFGHFCKLHGTAEDSEGFLYPSDKKKAEFVQELAQEYERYKAEQETRTAEEMDFITKWLHDVKIPIAASRLILESREGTIPGDLYFSLYKELFNIEESTMRVFYEMKSNRIFDDYRITKTNTGKLIAQALKGYSAFFSCKKLGIVVCGEDLPIRTDEKWSTYIISQLISNAVKYTPDGGQIEIRTVNNKDSVTVTVQNQGKGILTQDLERIFQKGYTSSDERQGAKSTGYGLYLSKKLAGLMGHTLIAESEPEQSASFHLTFPNGSCLQDL